MAEIYHQLILRSSSEKIFHAITTQEGLASWWTRETTASPEIGFVNQFRFGAPHGNEMKVTRLEQNSVEWECVGGPQEWIGTKVKFQIREKESGGFLLDFTHSGWASATEFFGVCNFNWGRYLLSLKHLLEKGQGHPYPDFL